MTSEEWTEAFAGQIGAQAPSEQEQEQLLRLAATAAHDSERIAAPFACWLAARAEKTLDELCVLAEQINPGAS